MPGRHRRAWAALLVGLFVALSSPAFGQLVYRIDSPSEIFRDQLASGVQITHCCNPTAQTQHNVEGAPSTLTISGSRVSNTVWRVSATGTYTDTWQLRLQTTRQYHGGSASTIIRTENTIPVRTIYSRHVDIDTEPSTTGQEEDPPVLVEGGGALASKSYRVKLSLAPTANATLTVTSGDTGAVTVDTDSDTNGLQSTLTFTTANWNTWRTVTASAADDTDFTAESVTITHTASGGGYTSTTSSSITLAATVVDDEAAEVLVDADTSTSNVVDAGPLVLNEDSARTGTYSVRLSRAPTASVTVALASDNAAVTLSASSLTFTTTNWATARNVTATTTQDTDAADEAADVTHTASGGGYGGIARTLRVGVTDDERTGTDYDTDEDGLIEIDSLAKLNAVRWDLNGDGAVTSGDQTNYNTAFPGASTGMGCPDGSDSNQTPDACIGYELTADLDFDTDNSGSSWTESSGDLTCDANDTYYNGGSGWDPIGPAATPTDAIHYNAVFEGNGHVIDNLCIDRTRSYTGLFAALRPNAQVRSLGLTNAAVYGGWSTGMLAAQSWGRIAAVWSRGTVRAPGNLGGVVGFLQGGTIVASYSTAAVHCTSTEATAYVGGLAGTGTGSGTILASYATGAVTGDCPAGSKSGLARGGRVEASYWDAISSGIDDDADTLSPEGKLTGDLQNPTAYGTGLYAQWRYQDVDGDGVRGEPNDDDAWSFGSGSQYPVLKFGGIATTPQFNAQPPTFGTGAVADMAYISGNAISAFQIPAATHANTLTYTADGLPPGLVFDADGSGTCQQARAICGTPSSTGVFVVTIWAGYMGGDRAGLRFTLIVGTIALEVDADPETPATTDAGPLALSEGVLDAAHSADYAVRLAGPPTANVTVTVTTADAGAVTVDTSASPGLQSALTFTTANWRTWQTVTAQAVQDADGADESVVLTHAASGGGFNGVSATLTANVDDDEVAEVLVDANPSTATVVDAGPLLLNEDTARTGNYAVRLSVAPGATVTVALASDNTAVTLSASSLTFTTANWATARTVTATTTHDTDAADEAADVTHTASGGGYDSVTATLRVGVTDDERTGTDYDTDEDGLIEISSLAQLNAVRWDLNGDGAVGAGDQTNYNTAFTGASTGMGCPDGGDANQTPDACDGYELTADLDFDTDGSGSSWTESSGNLTCDSNDTYYNSGSGWDPIGPAAAPADATHYNAVFEGNGHSIDNLCIDRTRSYTGLFAALRPSAQVRSLGLTNAGVYGGWSTGPLAAQSWGRIGGVWTSGTVRAPGNVGGLVGVQNSGGTIVASYSTAAVACTASGSTARTGGLVGESHTGATVAASYATGAVTGACPASAKSGVTSGGGTVRASYWDTELSGINDDAGSAPPEGKPSADLRTPTEYGETGLYATWDDEDVDGDGVAGGVADDVWNFGTRGQWPVLKFRGLDTATQFNLQPQPTAAITATSPAALTEATLDGATVTVTLTDSTFVSGVGTSGFQLNTGVPGLSVSSVTAVAGSTMATLTLGHTGADFDSAETLGVTVLAAAHFRELDITATGTVNVATSLEATALPANLSLNEAAGTTMANEGTFTAVLQSAPAATTTVAVASLDQGAATVSPSTLTFTTSDWNTAQTVTVTAQQDDDVDDETTTVTLTAAGVGVLETVTVTVADDDLGTVLVDADPSTEALDPGPLALVEDHATNGSKSYSVRLSARPNGNVTVMVASGDTGAVTASASSLTFTTANWNAAQTVTATAVNESDAVDESVTITHTATGGGYGGTSTELRVAVSDNERTGTDYDTDEDGLIEISTLAQLHAVRWDLDGNGAVAGTDQSAYGTAFPSASASMGCPAVSGTATCTGYELTADLDFDTDGDGTTHSSGTSDGGDEYHNSGAGFAPIGNRSAGLEATFDGNGHVVHNLFVNRTTSGTAGRDVGLFGAIGSAGVVRNLGVADAYVSSASDAVGALVGRHYGRVEASWASGSLTGNSGVGGLAGSTDAGSAIVASYSTASVTVSGSAGGGGGLAGWTGGAVAASYATGAVTGGAAQQGLSAGGGAVTSSYWDTEASGVATSTNGAGRTTSQLQNPTSATGPYAGWDRLDVDGDDDHSDAPWDFGTSSQYPALRVGSNAEASVFVQRGDYDVDDDGLIDVYALAHLNAIRWDLDGDGSSTDGRHRKAFRHHLSGMGCPGAGCTGYELMNDLDFDTDGDGHTHTAGTADSGDAYSGGGVGWAPIGSGANPYTAAFDGKGHVIDHLFISRQWAGADAGLFSATGASATIVAVGLPNAYVASINDAVGALVGRNRGRIAASWSTGEVRARSHGGGLVGTGRSGSAIVASYSTASVTATGSTGLGAGLVGDNVSGAGISASYATGAVTGGSTRHGLANGAGTVTASYWDTTGSGIADDGDSNPPEGRSRADLRAPTGYTGIYAAWDDQDVDGDGTTGAALDADDDAWNFGDAFTHPVLKFGGFDVNVQFGLQPNVAPTFTGTLPNVTVANGFAIDPIQAPTATGGEGVGYSYSATGLPAGLSFDEDGSGTCQQARTICGTPGTDEVATVTVYAHDGDVNRANSDRGSLTFTLTVTTPTAAITATSPATLTEATLDGATATVTLTNSTFASGVGVSGFRLNTGVPGLSVSSVTATGGTTTATLTLGHTGADFDSAQTLGVTVLAAAHALKGDVTTATVSVETSLEATASPANVSLQEAAGSTMANEGTFTAVLQSAPQATTTVAVASLDQGAVTVSPSTLTFTTSDWNTAQTVTVTAQQDDDADDETTTVTLTAAGVGVLASVTVTVAEDDAGTVVVDADPTTDAVDPGPLAHVEQSGAKSYAVRLSARPTGDVSVSVTSADAGAVLIASTVPLTFTAANWNTAQTVLVGAANDSDALDESVVITHTATGGGYGGTSTELRVAVSDDDRSGTDYDTDEDGLIEISSLAQLNAVRWDLDGNGAIGNTNYDAAFPSASAGMGCPAVSGTATCTGYELLNDLDFDTDGDGTTHTGGTGDSGDSTYYNSGAGWTPIGTRAAAIEAVFDGDGHVIYNLFVNRTTAGSSGRDTGLFGAVGTAGVVRNLGVADAWVSSASDAVGALVGRHYGRVEASWSSGTVTGNSGVGGLAGSTDGGSAIVASYSTASVTVTGSAGGGGGLAGWTSGDVAASYATGAVTGGAAQHGLAGGGGGATSSYWDTEASGVATSTNGAGRTTTQLQGPTSATGPFASWGRLDLDGDDDPSESPWDFGTSSQYPALRVGSNAEASAFVQRGDYDVDDDGLIDVYALAHLDAIRWDLDGDGASTDGRFRKAFRHHRDDMGCGAVAGVPTCTGYELMNDLDFDTDGDDSTHTNGASDPGDAYHNGGSGWDPIGPTATSSNPPTDATHFTATFDGGGHVVHNLFVNRSRAYVGLFAALRPDAVVRALGLRDAWIDGGWSSGALAGQSWGRVAGVWLTGTVEAPGNVGGLVGVQQSGALLLASYSTASVECTGTQAAALTGGMVGDNQTGAEIAASYSTGAVTGNCPTASKAGFANGSGQVGFSYWDTTISNIADDQDSNAPEGRTTVQLQMPTGYAGLYGAWDDYDVDGDNLVGASTDADDDAWEFGLSNQHPALKFGGLDTTLQFNQQPDLAPSFTAAAPSDRTVQNGRAIAPIQVPAAGAGNGAVTIAVAGLPAGLSFDADGSGTCGAERTICGTPSGVDGASTVTVTASDSDANVQSTDQATLTFRITVATPSAAITALNPAQLTENNLDGATVTVTLTNTTFGSGVTKSSFTLDTNVPGLDVDSVATVASGDASATLTLDYNGQDFDTARTLSVTVAASAHALAGDLTTEITAVAAGTGVRVAPPSLSLSEDPTAGGGTTANVGTYSVVLESQPAGSVTVTATSADAAVTLDAGGTPLTHALTFTTASWGTAQLVTATAAQDDDAADESVQVTHAVTGYPGVTTATSVTVAVDDDETAGVVLDADPSSPATAEAGPLALAELSSATNHSLSYTVRLTSPPTAAVTVTATSADAGAVTVDVDAAAGLQSALRFTSTNWATAQAVTLEAQQDADGVNESVAVTNAATTAAMGEYANVSATVTATVADDEAPGFVFDSDPSTPATADAAPLNLDELSGSGTNSDDYTVRLSSQPTQAVTVTVTSPDTGAVTVGASTLTFTTSNWATAQAVTLTAQQDDDGADESVDVEHAARTATSSEYTGVSATFEAAVDDDETPAITLSPTSLNVNEQDGATYAVSLATEPTGAVTVAITGAADGISANPTSLAFTASNWDTARTVTASAADDQDSVNETVTLTHTATGATEYDTLTEDLEVTALDNDQPGLRVDPTSLTVPEGGSGTYVIRLNTEPSASVTVTVSGAGSGVTADTDGGVTGDQNTLTFTAMTWGTDRTVTVSAAADDNGVDEVVTLSHAAAGGNYGSLTGSALPGVSVTADDDDVPAVLLDADPTTGNVDESGPQALDELAGSMSNSLGHTVRLATEPTADVTVTITSDDVGAVTVDDTQPGAGVQNWLRFTSSSWDTAQAVTLTAAQDADGVDEGVTVTHAATTASMGEYAGLSATLGATVDDDETPGFVFDRDPSTPAVADSGPLALDELSSSTTNSDIYTVWLAAQPTQDVTATIASDDVGAVTVGDTDGILNGVQNTLTFTTTSWDTPQTVTLTAQQDLDGADESLDIGHAASTATGSEYRGVSADFGAEVDDDETPGISLSTATLTVPEQDRETYTVVLDTEPSGGSGVVAVAITGAQDGIATNPTSLSFTTTNWATARTVTVRAADDRNSVNEQVTLRHTGSGADYGTLTADIVVTATDDDRPGLRVSPTQLTVHENGSAGYTVRLNTEPSAEVTVTVGGMTAEVTVDADGVTAGSQTTLLFDATNWSAARTVTVSAADDDDATDESVPLTHATAGGDYTGLLLEVRPGVSVTVDDDDEPALVLDADPSTPGVIDPGPLTLNELSGHADREKGYTVRLATEPTGAVTVDVSSGDRAVHVDAAPTPRMRTLTFTTTNWSMPQTVTATAAEDDDASDEAVTVSHSASGSDYADVSADLRVETTDDDTPALVVDAASLTGSGLAEGASATYTVRLDTEPTGRVLVSASAQGGVSVDADGGQSGLQPTLWFDAADWNVPQTVTVRARRDDDGASATATLRHSASGADYGGVSAAVSFAVTDPDAPAVRVSALSLDVNEGSAALYEVALATRPLGGAVTVALSSSNNALATVPSPMLIFTASDWSRPRLVSVQGVADGAATLSHAIYGADYGSVPPPTVSVTVRDSHAAGVRVDPPQLLLREGDSGSYSVRLNTAPAGTVTVTPSAAAGLSLVGGGPLLFTASDWSEERTVTVTAADDDDPNDGTLTVTHGVSGYAGVSSAPSLDVLVSDDDAPGFVFAPGGLSLSEGGGAASSATYQVRLATRPTGQVAVTASSDDAGLELDTDGTPRTLSLTFTASNWSSGQTVSVRAVADGDRVSETAVLLHEGSGGGYDGASGLLRVRVKDSEARPPRPEPPSSSGPPEVAGLFDDLELGPGESVLLDLSRKFFDDGPLRHAAQSSDPSVATAVVSGSGLRVAGLSPGVATVTVTATDLDGLSVSQSFRVSVGRMASFASAWASAPEGGTLRLGLTLSRPAPSSGLVVSWTGGPDSDPATADADAADLDVLSGTAEFAPGGTEAFIEISVLDDDDVEPARERLLASLTPPPEGAGWALGGLSEATLEIQEGVCDRTPAVREALRGARECWAPTPLDLSRRGYLGLRGLGLSSLRAGDLQGLSRLRALHLHGNRLRSLPTGLFEGLASLERLRLDGNLLPGLPEGILAGLGRLSSLRLDGNRLTSLPPSLLSGAPNLQRLDLSGNRLESLPPGLFAGLAGLSELNLEGNPGAPFALVMRLVRADAEPWAPGPASVQAQVAEGAPFALSAEVLADGAELSSASASVPAGALSGPPLQAEPTGPGAARLSLSGMPQVPQGRCGDVQDGMHPCFRGLSVEAGPALVLFKPPPGTTDEPPMPTLSANGERASIALDGLFSPSEAEDRLSYEAESDRPDLVGVRILDGALLLLIANEDGAEGTAVVTVTATDPDGQSATLSFAVTVEFAPQRLLRSWRLEWLRGLREAAQ